MKKPRVLNLRDTDANLRDPQVYTDRFVLTLRGNAKHYQYQQIVHVHVEWAELPWLMRKIWQAWKEHKKKVLANIAWVEREVQGDGAAD